MQVNNLYWKQCIYNSKWELCHDYKDWISCCKQDKKKAFCKLCDRAAMGESAVKSHMRSAKDKNGAAMGMKGEQLTGLFDSSTTLI